MGGIQEKIQKMIAHQKQDTEAERLADAERVRLATLAVERKKSEEIDSWNIAKEPLAEAKKRLEQSGILGILEEIRNMNKAAAIKYIPPNFDPKSRIIFNPSEYVGYQAYLIWGKQERKKDTFSSSNDGGSYPDTTYYSTSSAILVTAPVNENQIIVEVGVNNDIVKDNLFGDYNDPESYKNSSIKRIRENGGIIYRKTYQGDETQDIEQMEQDIAQAVFEVDYKFSE